MKKNNISLVLEHIKIKILFQVKMKNINIIIKQDLKINMKNNLNKIYLF
jgi:hypothetical protein